MANVNGEATLPPIMSNAGIKSKYQRQLTKSIDAMVAGLPAAHEITLSALEDYEKIILDEWVALSVTLSPLFVHSVNNYTDKAFTSSLRAAGVSVPNVVSNSSRVQGVVDASIAENVELIRSIPSVYLDKVREAVSSYTIDGSRDIQGLTDRLLEIADITKGRAELIAFDQTNKATSSFVRARQLDVGIREAVWMHSSAGKVPRPSHVAKHGKRYDPSVGMYIDNEYIFPGEKINCRCTSRSVLPATILPVSSES